MKALECATCVDGSEHPYEHADERRIEWDALSEDIHGIVLGKLPFFSLIRLRTVCKKWNALILSLLISHSQSSSAKTVPIYFSHGQLSVFDSRKNSWEEQCLDCVKFPSYSLSLLVAAGGLLCFKTNITGELIVCNPISLRCKYLHLPKGFSYKAITDPLPDLLKPVVTLEGGKEAIGAFQRSFGREVLVGLLTETHKQWYKLVVAGISDDGSESGRTTLVYDSFSERWKKGSAVPKGARFWESGKSVNVNGCLYCITFTAGLSSGTCDLDWPWSIVRYDSDNDIWTEIHLGRRGSILPQLVEHRGHILVIRRNGKAENEISFSELKDGESMFSLTTKHLPSRLFPPKAGKRCPMIMQDWCVGQGDWLYIAGRHREKETGTRCPRGLVILAHNFTTDSWTRLPTMTDVPTLRDHFSATLYGFHNATWLHAFEPTLCAKV